MVESLGVFVGASVLGFVHGVLPDHGWPVAAMWALDQRNKWLYGALSGGILGIGHLVSSIAVVVAFFWAQSTLGLTDLGWLDYVAGGLLIVLGVREYVHGHSHDHGTGDHSHGHDADAHSHDYDDGAHSHDHDGDSDRGTDHDPGHAADDVDERGLWGIVAFAFALGFAHNEEIEILALCTGSTACLELMTVYALSVLGAVVAMTLLLVAGFERYESRLQDHEDTIFGDHRGGARGDGAWLRVRRAVSDRGVCWSGATVLLLVVVPTAHGVRATRASRRASRRDRRSRRPASSRRSSPTSGRAPRVRRAPCHGESRRSASG